MNILFIKWWVTLIQEGLLNCMFRIRGGGIIMLKYGKLSLLRYYNNTHIFIILSNSHRQKVSATRLFYSYETKRLRQSLIRYQCSNLLVEPANLVCSL